MIKRLFSKFSRDRGIHKATVHIDFFPQDLAVPSISWYHWQNQEQETVILSLFFYARILYELAELNETRVANELMAFLDQVRGLVLGDENSLKRPQLPLGSVQLGQAHQEQQPERRYRGEFFQFQDNNYRLDFEASLGKEGYYLPAAFLVFLQSCINNLPDENLKQLITRIGRLHTYYQYRKDFWDGTAITAGPVFALGSEEISTDEAALEA